MKKLLIAFLMMVMPLCANAALSPSITLTGDCMIPVARHVWGIEDNSVYAFVNSVIAQFKIKRDEQVNYRGLEQEDMVKACLAANVEVTSADCINKTYEECYLNSDCGKFIMAAWKCEEDKLAAREAVRQEALKVFQKAFPCTNGKNFPDSELCQHTFFKDYGVGPRQAPALINVWSHRKMLKEGTDAIANTMMKCDETKIVNNCMQCELGETGVKFEFCFASLNEAFDKNIHDDVMAAGCKLFDTSIKSVVKNVNVTYGASSFAAGMDVSGMSSPYSADTYKICDGADKTMCFDLQQNFFAKLGGAASWIDGTGCVVNIPPINHVSQLEQMMGIDSFYFCKMDIQVQATQSTVDNIENYIGNKIPFEKGKDFIMCEPTHRIYNGDECRGGAVLRCKIYNGSDDQNPMPFDMVFADLSEWNKQKSRDSAQALSCVGMNGTFTGDICIVPDRDACMKLRAANLQDCPGCKKIWWDEAENICRLPESDKMRSIEKGTKILMYVGGAVATVAISMATGPAGVMLVLDVISVVGTTMAAGSDLYIDGFASEFFVESSNCRDATCAKNIVHTHLVKMQNYANQGDLSYAQLEAADTEIARLVELIPEQDDFWVDLINSGAELSVSSAAENANAFDFSRWEPEHWVRALGTALEMVTLVQAAGEMFLRFNPKTAQSLNKAVNAVKTKVSNVIASLSKSDDAADAADAAFRAQLSAKRAALQEKLAKGEIIRGTDDAIVIPKGQMAAGIRKADGTVTITAKSKYKFVNALDNVTQSELGKSLNVGFVGDDMVYHMDGLTKPQLAGMKEILSDHNIPYYEHTTGGILFYEKDIVRFGSDIDPNLSSKVQDMLQFEEQAMAQTDDFAKAATQTSEKTIRMFNNNIYLEDLYRVAANKREKILNIVARDSELTDIALNFETASLERKQRFAQKILNNLEGGNITAEVKISHSAVGEQDKARIIFGLNHKENTSLDGFITTLSHEHNHYINQYKPKTGALADLPEEILDRTITNRELFDEYFPNADYDWYYINSLDEQSSYYIGDYVGQGFKNDLIDLISPRR